MKTVFNIFVTLLLIDVVAGQSCSLCPGGSGSITDPYATLGPNTCKTAESQLTAVPSAACTAMTLGVNFYFDMTAFCCSDVPTPTEPTCDVCKDGYIIMKDDIPTPGNNLVSTCGELKFASYYAEAGPACNILQDAAITCCEKAPPTYAPTKSPTSSPTESPTTSPAPTDAPVSSSGGGGATINAVTGQEPGADSGASSNSIMLLGTAAFLLSWIM